MEALAFGRMGMAPAVFDEMTPREFVNAVKGYSEKNEQEMQERWEQARLIAYYSAAPHLKRNKPMAALIPLPWDRPATKPNPYSNFTQRPTPEQIERMMGRLVKTIPGWHRQLARS